MVALCGVTWPPSFIIAPTPRRAQIGVVLPPPYPIYGSDKSPLKCHRVQSRQRIKSNENASRIVPRTPEPSGAINAAGIYPRPRIDGNGCAPEATGPEAIRPPVPPSTNPTINRR